MKGRSMPRGKTRVISTGKKPPVGGVTKGKTPKETTFQKLLKGWPPKVK